MYDPVASRVELPNVFTEMLRSFVVLGETQNLSAAVEKLKVSRQTIRRHINMLEELKGIQLFHENDRQYRLTNDGKLALEGAKQLLKNSCSWLNDKPESHEGLRSVSIEVSSQAWMYAQRHRLSSVWDMAPPIIHSGLNAWIAAQGSLDHEAMEAMRPYMLVYRKYRDDWLLVQFGSKSAYATWLGASLTKSELGRQLDLGNDYGPILDTLRYSYEQVLRTGSSWYEHLAVCIPVHKDGEPIPVQYQRLIVASKFADSSPAVVVFSARTDISEIPVRPKDRHILNLPENLMDGEVEID